MPFIALNALHKCKIHLGFRTDQGPGGSVTQCYSMLLNSKKNALSPNRCLRPSATPPSAPGNPILRPGGPSLNLLRSPDQ
jgi:hypothetical protein